MAGKVVDLAAKKKMPLETYERIRNQLAVLAQVVEGLDLDGFIAEAQDADTKAKTIDLSLYAQAHGSMQTTIALAEAARDFRVRVVGIIVEARAHVKARNPLAQRPS